MDYTIALVKHENTYGLLNPVGLVSLNTIRELEQKLRGFQVTPREFGDIMVILDRDGFATVERKGGKLF